MKRGKLLWEMIDIAKTQKTDFAISMMFHDILSRKIENNEMKILEFRPGLWQVYLDAVSKNLERIGF